jgi:hypothetical protein
VADWCGEHEGVVVSASGNSLATETHRGSAAPVRVVQRDLTVAEALRWAPVAPRRSYNTRRE